jgi:methylmalonyl-CoA epimerase
MKAVLDHIGIAVKDLAAALAFYRDALGLEIEAPEEVASQRVRAHFVPLGESKLELLEATADDSPIAKYVDKRGPGLHHITLRVEDIHAALAQLKARGTRLIDEQPRPGAEGGLVAFVHPASAHGVLDVLKQYASESQSQSQSAIRSPQSAISTFTLGDVELVSLSDGFLRADGGSMFGTVPKPQWEAVAPADGNNRITLALRPLLVRGTRTLIIGAGFGDKASDELQQMYGVERSPTLDQTLAEAGIAPEHIDVVLATHLHVDHAGGFTVRDAGGRLRPRFPRAQYIARRGEWDDATHPDERSRASYVADDFMPLAEAGVLQLVDDDVTIMPGVRVRRTGGHTMHHQIVVIESGGKSAAFVSDLMPTTAHVRDAWIAADDLYPMDSLHAKTQFLKEAEDKDILVFFEHDPAIAAGYIREHGGKRVVLPALG